MILGISLTQPGQEGNQKLIRVTLPCRSALETVFPCRSGREKSGRSFAVGDEDDGKEDADQCDDSGGEYFFHSDKASNARARVAGKLTVRCVAAWTGIRVMSASAADLPFGSVIVRGQHNTARAGDFQAA